MIYIKFIFLDRDFILTVLIYTSQNNIRITYRISKLDFLALNILFHIINPTNNLMTIINFDRDYQTFETKDDLKKVCLRICIIRKDINA